MSEPANDTLGTRLQWIGDRYFPPGLDTDGRQRAASLVLAGIAVALQSVVLAAQFALGFGEPWPALSLLICGVLIVGLVPRVLRSFGLTPAAHLYVALLIGDVTVRALLHPQSPWNVMWIGVMPAFGAFVFGRRRHVLFWLVTCLTLVVTFFVLQGRGALPEPVVVLDGVETAICGVTTMLFFALICYVVSRPALLSRQRLGEERDSLRARLEQAQRLESLGRLSGEIAHDFNNILSAAMGAASVARDIVDAAHEVHSDLEIVVDALERGKGMTRQLLAFARQGHVSPVPTCVNSTVADMQTLLRRMVGASVGLKTDLGTDIDDVLIDPHQLHRVLLNLATNARDAMPDGGQLAFTTRRVWLDGPSWDGLIDLQAGDYVIVEVADTGEGMPPQVSERIFEPFFTTKGEGRGTGLGLASAYGIVRQAGGDMAVRSAPGEGTTFSIALPVQRARPTAASTARQLRVVS